MYIRDGGTSTTIITSPVMAAPDLTYNLTHGLMSPLDTLPYLAGTYGTQQTSASGAHTFMERVQLGYADTANNVSSIVDTAKSLATYLPIVVVGIILVGVLSLFRR